MCAWEDAALAKRQRNDFFIGCAAGSLADGDYVMTRGAERSDHREIATLIRKKAQRSLLLNGWCAAQTFSSCASVSAA